MINGRVSFKIDFKRSKHALLWKFSVISRFPALRFYHYEISSTIHIPFESIDLSINLLAYLRTSFQRTKIERLFFNEADTEIIQACEKFLGEIRIDEAGTTLKDGKIDES